MATPRTLYRYDEFRFLIADDNHFVRSSVTALLTRAGATTIAQVSDGEEALEALEMSGGRFDFIIADWNMHPVSGFDLLRRIRANKVSRTRADLPFLFLVELEEAPLLDAAGDLDIHAYVTKPVSFEVLTKAVDTAIALRRKHRRLEDLAASWFLNRQRIDGRKP